MSVSKEMGSASYADDEGIVTVDCDDRWGVYFRLKSLDIDCQCAGFEPLKVRINTPVEAIQLWSVVNQMSKSRLEVAIALEKSWKLPCHR